MDNTASCWDNHRPVVLKVTEHYVVVADPMLPVGHLMLFAEHLYTLGLILLTGGNGQLLCQKASAFDENVRKGTIILKEAH